MRAPFSFGYPFFLRSFVPGTLAIALCVPLVAYYFAPTLKDFGILDWIAIFSIGAIIVGVFVSLADDLIYRLYEGRIFQRWWLHGKLVRRLDSKIQNALKKAADAKGRDKVVYDEIWWWLRMFPVDRNGCRFASAPTTLGNIIKEYENYPKSRYGMDSIFYWYRLWLAINEDSRKAVDLVWAHADSVLYSSFVFLFFLVLYSLLTAGSLILMSWAFCGRLAPTAVDYLPSLRTLCFLTFISAGGTCFAYHFAIPLQRRIGEYFKSIFDVYRKEVSELSDYETSEAERDTWEKKWAYLQYLRVKCPKCGEFHYAGKSHSCSQPQ